MSAPAARPERPQERSDRFRRARAAARERLRLLGAEETAAVGAFEHAAAALQGREFLSLEVNGWHNIVHIASGALLLFASPKAKLAGTALLVFGLTYAVVTIWGFLDGDTVANLIPVNLPDNLLHLLLAAGSLFVALTAGALGTSARRAGPAR